MKRISIGLAATLATVVTASAQTYLDSKGTVVSGVVPLVGCASGGNCAGPVSSTNPLPVTGSFAATLSGFQPGSAYATPLSVSTTSSRVALPAGTVVVVYNTGAAAAYVQLGGSNVAATTSNDVVPAGGWMAFDPGTNTYLAAITASGTTTLNVSGGSGLPSGAGGGGAAPGSASFVSGAASTNGTSATTIVAAPASGKLYITSAQCFRTDTGATPVLVTFNDAAATAMGLSGSGVGAGNNMVFSTPLVVAATTAFKFTAGAAVASVYCNAQGYNAP